MHVHGPHLTSGHCPSSPAAAASWASDQYLDILPEPNRLKSKASDAIIKIIINLPGPSQHKESIADET